MNRVNRLALLCIAALMPFACGAADYPSAPVRLVVGFAPGGGTDGAARIVGERLAMELGQTVIVENRAGAGGTIGAKSVMSAQPDGHTLLFGTGAELVVNPVTRKTVPYAVLKDFTPIAEVGGVQFVLVVAVASPAKSVPELISLAQARPGALNFSSFGVGSTNHLLSELFLSTVGIKATHVPYQGSGPAMTALLSGAIHFAFETAAVALPHIQAGKLRALATPSPRRLQALADVPTLQELGFKDLVAEGWMGVFGPAGTPAPIVQRLNEALVKVLRLADVEARLNDRGVLVSPSSPEDFRRRLAIEVDKWRHVASKSGLSLE